MTHTGQFLGSNMGGREERECEGRSKIGPLMEVTEGFRKWAVLKVGLPSPVGEIMSSFLVSVMAFDGSSIIDDKQRV